MLEQTCADSGRIGHQRNLEARERPGRPDLQLRISPCSRDFHAVPWRAQPHGGLNICVYRIRPESRGSVMIESRDPAALPQIVPNYGTQPGDREIVPRMMRYVRRLVSQPPLAGLILEETRPGKQFANDRELEQAWRQFGYANYHSSGTCRMGRDSASVVDPECRVRGTHGLRVVDTSIFPFMLAGNTNAPAMALAWRAADIIAGTWTFANTWEREGLSALAFFFFLLL
jgi:choline dehydrogenase-like flavoprotein